MKQRIIKEFNVKDAQNGAIVETKDGHSVRILCYDRRCIDYPIIALVNFDKNEQIYSYNTDGILYNSSNDNKNLVIIDEIKYKFDEGDYIVGEVGFVYKITEIDNMYHTMQVSSGYRQKWTIEDVESNFHKWTIQDAKVGDILTIIKDNTSFIFKGCLKNHPNHPTAFCGIDSLNNLAISKSNYLWTINDVRPANTTEKELFYNKVKEAGYEWNSDTLTLSKIEKWRNKEGTKMNGYYISSDATIYSYDDGVLCRNSYNVFATKKQAKSALAMARISQIMDNDNRFGGTITDEEWNTDKKYTIIRRGNNLGIETRYCYEYLSFHTNEQAELFLKENEDLIKDYYMID